MSVYPKNHKSDVENELRMVPLKSKNRPYLIFRMLQIARSISSIDRESIRSFSASFLYLSNSSGYRNRRCIGAFSKLSMPCLNNWSSLFSFSATFKYAKKRSFSSLYGSNFCWWQIRRKLIGKSYQDRLKIWPGSFHSIHFVFWLLHELNIWWICFSKCFSFSIFQETFP